MVLWLDQKGFYET